MNTGTKDYCHRGWMLTINNLMLVDLDNLTNSQSELFVSFREQAIIDYNLIVEDVIKLDDKNVYWLLNNVTSRNTVVSSVLYYLNCILFLDNISKTEHVDKVKTSDPVLSSALKSNYQVECRNSYVKYICIRFLRNCWHHFYNIEWCLRAILVKSKNRYKDAISQKGITLVDTFIAKPMDSYFDRYYGNIINKIDCIDNDTLYFLINYLPKPDKIQIEKIEKNTKQKILFNWDFLKVSDYISTIWHIIFPPRHSFESFNYYGTPLKSVLENCVKNSTSFYFVNGLLYYYSVRRMKKLGVDIKLLVDWFENQSYDKALYYAFNKFYPNSWIHGYIGFLSDTDAMPYNIATNQELRCHIAPKELFVCNKALKSKYKKSKYEGTIHLAPLFRTQKVWSVQRKPKKESITIILVPLTLDSYEVEFKVCFMDKICENLQNVHILLKPHPAYDVTLIKKQIEHENKIEIVNGDIYNFLEMADMVVGSNTTVIYEALALGLPIVNIEDPTGILYMAKPNLVSKNLWKTVSSAPNMLGVIKEIQNQSIEDMISEGKSLRNYYFEPVTEQGVKDLFGVGL